MNNDRGRACAGRIFPAPGPKTTCRVGPISTPNLSAGNVRRRLQSTPISGVFGLLRVLRHPALGAVRVRQCPGPRCGSPARPGRSGVVADRSAGISRCRCPGLVHVPAWAGRADSAAHGATPLPVAMPDLRRAVRSRARWSPLRDRPETRGGSSSRPWTATTRSGPASGEEGSPSDAAGGRSSRGSPVPRTRPPRLGTTPGYPLRPSSPVTSPPAPTPGRIALRARVERRLPPPPRA